MTFRNLGLSAALLSLFSTTAVIPANAQTAAIDAPLERARALAGDDPYLQQTFMLQCNEPDANGKPITAGNYLNNAQPVPPTQLFDNLYYIGDSNTGSFLFTTEDGYIMVDAGYGNGPETIILPALQELGLDPALLKYILITHPGPDHLGGAKYFQEHYGTKIVMSEKDWDAIDSAPATSWVNSHLSGEETYKFWQGPPARDQIGADGMNLKLGDTVVTMVATPRSADGGALSYIFPVTDQGKAHVWATYGATGAPRSPTDFPIYQASVAHISQVAAEMGVDVVISNHPFVDGSVRRMGELANRDAGEANPFVIGADDVARYFGILGECASVWVARDEAGLGMTASPLAPKQ